MTPSNYIKIILLLLLVLPISCSKDDTEDFSCNVDFLECYDNSVWVQGEIIYRFNNDTNNPIEKWYPCSNSNGFYHVHGEDFELIENTADKLMVKEVWTTISDYGHHPIWTFEP